MVSLDDASPDVVVSDVEKPDDSEAEAVVEFDVAVVVEAVLVAVVLVEAVLVDASDDESSSSSSSIIADSSLKQPPRRIAIPNAPKRTRAPSKP